MKTVGEYISKARVKKKFSKNELSKKTKIKKEFVTAIEEENWEVLPEFPVVQGFVKSIAQTLGVDEKQATALLRRDYPPKDININPKPDVSSKFSWNPRMTFIAGVVLVTLLVLSYLGYEYFQFISPPSLSVSTPQEGILIENDRVRVAGTTEPDATLKINNQPVVIEEDGSFTVEIEISEETNEIVVVSSSRSGKETVVRRKIEKSQEE